MSRKEKLLLALSTVASISIWGAVYGWKFGLTFVVSLLIHEFGHYRQMGREGISKRTMFMMPPFGAVAVAKEPWPTRLAETKIALAGPLWGAISVLVLLFWQRFVQPVPFFAASAAIVAFVNLFNLALPVAVLDGGRVIKSALFSWQPVLGLMFHFVSIAVLFILVFHNPFLLPITLILLLVLNNERGAYVRARSELAEIRQKLMVIEETQQIREYEAFKKALLFWLQAESALGCSLDPVRLREREKNLRLVAEPLPMTKRQITFGLAGFFALNVFFLGVMSGLFNTLNIEGGSVFGFLEQLFKLVK